MRRRDFFTTGSWAAAGAAFQMRPARTQLGTSGGDELVIERFQPGKPHQGKVLAAVQPHADDIPLFAAGTVANRPLKFAL